MRGKPESMFILTYCLYLGPVECFGWSLPGILLVFDFPQLLFNFIYLLTYLFFTP